MAAYNNLSRQFTDKKGKTHEITANPYGEVTAKSGKIRTGGMSVLLNFNETRNKQPGRENSPAHLIFGIATHGNYKRRGLATEMYRVGEEAYGPIEIGTTTEEGAEWKKAMGRD